MAGRDGSGPDGRGPMTGRGWGNCAGNERPGYAADVAPAGRGARRGYGRGRGFGNGFGSGFGRGSANFDRSGDFGPEKEVVDKLSDEIAALRNQLKALEDRLGNLNSED